MTNVPRIILDRVVNGVDYTKPPQVLIRKGNLELWWMRGATSYIDRMSGTRYGASSLALADNKSGGIAKDICEGGRLSAAKLLENWDAIEAFFEVRIPREFAATICQRKPRTILL
jgi:hypothetical protein